MTGCKCVTCAGRTVWCFWGCGRRGLTLDHVVPQCLGGKRAHNLVAACRRCQESRGCAQNAHGNAAQFAAAAAEKWEWGTTRDREWLLRWRQRLAERVLGPARRLAAAWAVVEHARWGDAPSARLVLDLPPLPPESVTIPRPPEGPARDQGRVHVASLLPVDDTGGAES